MAPLQERYAGLLRLAGLKINGLTDLQVTVGFKSMKVPSPHYRGPYFMEPRTPVDWQPYHHVLCCTPLQRPSVFSAGSAALLCFANAAPDTLQGLQALLCCAASS